MKGNTAKTTLSVPGKEGLYHIVASSNGLETCHLPVKVSAEESLGIYWGLLHAHTKMSDGLQTIDEYYTYGRDIGFLDICAANDHAEHINADDWQEYVAGAERYNDPGRYVTLLGYEWTRDNHRNVYFPTAEPDLPLLRGNEPETNTYAEFVAALKRSGKRVIIGKHTAHPVDTRMHDPEFERLVEIQSMWSTSEYPGCPGSMSSTNFVPIGSGQTLLGCGYRVAFVGGGDSHSGRPGRNWHGTRWGALLPFREGQTAVLAPRLDRESVFNALDRLHCYAVSGPRILVDFRAGEHIMGDQFETSENPKFKIEVGAVGELARVELLRDNYPIVTYYTGGMTWSGEVEDGNVPAGVHWYYVRVMQKDGERAWATPIWVTKR